MHVGETLWWITEVVRIWGLDSILTKDNKLVEKLQDKGKEV